MNSICTWLFIGPVTTNLVCMYTEIHYMPAQKRLKISKTQRQTAAIINTLPLSKPVKIGLIALVVGLPSLCALLVIVAAVMSYITSTLPVESQDSFSFAIILFVLAVIVFIIMGILYFIQREKEAKMARQIAWERAMATWSQSSHENLEAKSTNVKQLSPYQLETFAVSLFAKMGYLVVHTGKTHDGGIDVHLTNPNKQTELVQCKQWSKPVGEPEVRDLAGAMLHENAVRGFIIAPGGFTENARRWAIGKRITLTDEDEINRLVFSVYGDNGEKAQ